jgi:hypothetical protein
LPAVALIVEASTETMQHSGRFDALQRYLKGADKLANIFISARILANTTPSVTIATMLKRYSSRGMV